MTDYKGNFHLPAEDPGLDYGRDGDFLVDIPSPKEECE